jgi:hypothetical protein
VLLLVLDRFLDLPGLLVHAQIGERFVELLALVVQARDVFRLVLR